ncbi:MAG: sugar ABC transporter ATP-binding protein [Thermoleophilaceae bacterium]
MSGAALLTVRDLRKSFGGTEALRGVSLDVRAGEVHGLVGQNGSGKSTLIKILSGYHVADDGEVVAAGEGALDFVHQDLGLVGTMSALENLRVGRYETGRLGRIRWRAERGRVTALLKRFELDIDPDTPIERLSQAERAIVAIMRAIDDLEQHHGAGVLVLDEPTAALPANEVGRLFNAVRRITEAGSGVLFVTHNLDEVFEITDRVTVLRDGALVRSADTAELTEKTLIELIVGHALGDIYPVPAGRLADAALEVDGLTGAVVERLTFAARRGEILGLTGLVGAGQDEVPYLVYGATVPAAGGVRVDGRLLEHPGPERSLAAGLVLLPADRHRLSAIPGATVKENVTLPVLRRFRRGPRLDHRAERTAVQDVLGRFDVRPADPDRPLVKLSGGNQQRALLGRCLRMDPRVLLLHEPTQGVDVGARRGIFEMLRDAAAAGASIVYSSVEYEDLANVCDRVLVFRRGRVVAELEGGSLTKEAVLSYCYQTEGATAA